jgi:hypothetical protein
MEVADLGDATRLTRVGLTRPVPGRGGWKPFQEVGEALWREGWPGLVAPSAARPDGMILCLFIDSRGVLPARSLGRPRVVKEPPAPPAGMRS